MSYDELKKVENLIITTNDVIGMTARFAVEQSPYTVPDNLGEALVKLEAIWPFDQAMPSFKHQTFVSMNDLEHQLTESIDAVPEIVAWNNRKNGRDGIGFSSRYDQPAADDDFIDLGALARNIAMALWKDAVEFKNFNDRFDQGVTRERVDERAKAIYDKMPYDGPGTKPAWQEGGNSNKQNEARSQAREQLEAEGKIVDGKYQWEREEREKAAA